MLTSSIGPLSLLEYKFKKTYKRNWKKYGSNLDINHYSKSLFELESTEEDKLLFEGNPTEVRQTRYERNPYARRECPKIHGYSCKVCEFDFEKCFGTIGKQFMHVHHLKKISSIGEAYQVDPVKDLVPVCPNCHAMLHKENPPIKIEKLKEIIAKHKSTIILDQQIEVGTMDGHLPSLNKIMEPVKDN
jgi:predicted HNH restriction endonuclease